MKSLQITAIIILIYLQIKGFRQEILQPSCGRRLVRHVSLITNGFDSNEGDWPWHTAIFRLKNSSYKYICGGTLINSDSVLTAAHCVYEDNRLIIAERLSVQLGRHNLKNIGTNIEEFSAYRIIPHPNYSTKYLSNDIAVIRLSTHATYNKYIQPICLPTSNVEISEVTGKFGTVIGWGVTEKDVISDESLRQAVMPVVSSVTCLESNRDLFGAFLSDRNFCAGFRNGTSVCTGDSGGSLAFEENGVYSIRGIVSLSGSRKDNRNFCDPNEYVLFTDVAKYLTWIEDVAPQIKSCTCNVSGHKFSNNDCIMQNKVEKVNEKLSNISTIGLTNDLLQKVNEISVSIENTGTFKRNKRTRGNYVGCYQDRAEHRGLRGFATPSSSTTIESCISICRDGNYVYAGLQSSNWCLCGNTMQRPPLNNKLSEISCNLQCAGNSSQMCGGAWVNSIYETGVEQYLINEEGLQLPDSYISPDPQHYFLLL